VLGLGYRNKDTLGALLQNFRRRVETSSRLDRRGPVRLPARWDSLEEKLKELNSLRNKIAHANYREVLSLVPTDPRRSRAVARRCFNALVDAIRVTNRPIGYEPLTTGEARRYYSRLKLRWKEAPNKRMKLSRRGGHFCRKKSALSVAAPSRSLCAIR